MKSARRWCSGALALVLALIANPVSADWRDEVETLRIGVLATGDVTYRRTILEPFRAYLAKRLQMPVEIVPVGSYAELIDAQTGARIQYAIHSATSYATAVEQCDCIEAIAAPVALGGALGFYSILVARADDPIRTLADARDKRVALTHENSVAGHLVPMKAFAAAGIDPDNDFTEVLEVDDPHMAIESLFAGKSDLAVAWSSLTGEASTGYDFGVLTRMVADGTLSMDSVRIVWQSRLIPFGPHAVRSDVPPELKAALSDAMASVALESPEALDAVDRQSFGGGGFASPDPSLYAIARELVAAPAE